MNPLSSEIHPFPSPVFLIRDHDEALTVWQQKNIQGEILLHFDAHMDFEWTREDGAPSPSPDHQKVHLGNYLHRALQNGIVREWHWIIPHPMWNSRQTRARLWKELLFTFKTRSGAMTAPIQKDGVFTTSILGIPVRIGPLNQLPSFQEPVLLNLDTDFLFAGELTPWLWPDEFHGELTKKCRSLLTTVAYSVNGGYTPIAFKFFGQALQNLFSQTPLPEAYESLKKFFVSGTRHTSEILRPLKAEGDFETARLYQKSLIELRAGRQDLARLWFAACAKKDPDFTSADNNNAWHFFSRGRFQEAFEEYQTLAMLGDDSLHRLAGEARCLSAMNRPAEAKIRCLKALEYDPSYAPCLFLAGQIEASQGRLEQAVSFLLQCLQTEAHPLMARLLLGECYYRQSRLKEAKETLRQVLGEGGHLPVTYFLLAKTYWKLGYRKKSLEFFGEWLRLSWRQHREA